MNKYKLNHLLQSYLDHELDEAERRKVEELLLSDHSDAKNVLRELELTRSVSKQVPNIYRNFEQGQNDFAPRTFQKVSARSSTVPKRPSTVLIRGAMITAACTLLALAVGPFLGLEQAPNNLVQDAGHESSESAGIISHQLKTTDLTQDKVTRLMLAERPGNRS